MVDDVVGRGGIKAEGLRWGAGGMRSGGIVSKREEVKRGVGWACWVECGVLRRPARAGLWTGRRWINLYKSNVR